MNYTLYLAFSSIEFFSIIFFGFCLFSSVKQLNKRGFINLFYLSIGLSFLSITLKYYNILQSVAPFIFMGLIMLLLRPLTKIKKLLCLYIAFFSYLICFAIQTIILVIADFFGVVKFGFDPLSFQGTLLQIFSTTIIIIIAVFRLHRGGGGFIFNPDKHHPNLRYSNKLFLFLSLFILSISIVGFAEAKITLYATHVYIMLAILLVSTIALLFASYKRDAEEVDIDLHKFINKRKETLNENRHL